MDNVNANYYCYCGWDSVSSTFYHPQDMYYRSWKLAPWLNISINTSEKHNFHLSHMLRQAPTSSPFRPQHHMPHKMAIHPQPIPFKHLTWWLWKSNGLSAALFWESKKSPNTISFLKSALLFPLLSIHPLISLPKLSLAVCKWEDSCELTGLSPSYFFEQPTEKWRGFLCVCVFMGVKKKACQVIIQDSHCVSGLMRWRLIARSGQQLFGTGWQTAQREDGSHRRGGRSE